MTECLDVHLLQSAYWLAAGLPIPYKSIYAPIIVARWAAILLITTVQYKLYSHISLSPSSPYVTTLLYFTLWVLS